MSSKETTRMLSNDNQKIIPSEAWLQKRKITTIAFIVEVFFIGVEYSVVFLTLWSYITNLVETENPKLYYSIIASSYLLSSVVMSLILGKIIDKTREINKIFMLANSFAVIGNILYAIYFSPAYLIAGRLIAGCAAPLKSIVSSELARSYPKDDLLSKISLVGMSYGAGFLVGPGINFVFLKVDFFISKLHITVSNAAGIYMAVIFFILNIIMYFFVHDLSKEFDLKAEAEKLEEEKNKVILSSTSTSREAVGEAITLLIKPKNQFNIFCDSNLVLIMITSYFMLLLMVSMDMDLPILILNTLKWSLLELNVIVFGIGVLAVLSMLYMSKRTINEKLIYYMFLCSLISCVVVLAILLIIKNYAAHSKALTIALWCVWVVLFTLVCVAEETYLISAFAKMVPSRIQTFAESVRLGFARGGSITALSVSALLFEYFKYYALFLAFVFLLILAFVVNRRLIFMHPGPKHQ